jgi:hypothetical protein
MEHLVATAKVSDSGALEFAVPPAYNGATVEIRVEVIQKPDQKSRAANGWPVGFFEKYVGCIEDPTFVRPPQGVLEPVPPFE